MVAEDAIPLGGARSLHRMASVRRGNVPHVPVLGRRQRLRRRLRRLRRMRRLEGLSRLRQLHGLRLWSALRSRGGHHGLLELGGVLLPPPN